MWDNETVFSSRQALADGPSDNVVDIGPGDAGLGEPLYLQVSLAGAATGELTVPLLH